MPPQQLDDHLIDLTAWIKDASRARAPSRSKGAAGTRTSASSTRGGGGSAGSVVDAATATAQHALAYLHAICSQVADVIVNSEVFPALAACVRSRHAAAAARLRAAAVVGLVLRHATEIDADVNMAAVSFTTFVDLV